MKRVGIFVLVAFVYVVGILIYFSGYVKKDIEEFERLKLSYAIDYASDAAVINLLSSQDLAMDYADKGYISANPDLALDTFVDVFLFNYGAGIDNTNREHVKMNFMPVFVVAMFDGYYMGTPVLVKNDVDYPEGPITNGDWSFTFTPKLPYTYESAGDSYALNMGGDYALKMSGNILSKDYGLPPGITTKDDVRRQITKIVSAHMAYEIDTFNATNPDWANSFYIPGDLTTLSSVNPIEGPSVLTIVQNVDFATSKPIGAFSVAGSKITTTRMVAGYTRAGIMYYCYTDKMPLFVSVENIYASPKDAAKAGYAMDVEFME